MDRKIGLRNGTIAGGIVVLYFLLFYFIQKELMLSIGVAWSSVLVYIYFMYRSVGMQRAALGGTIAFREAVSTAFLTFVVANAIYYLFYFLLVTLDPSLVEILKQISIEFWDWFLAAQSTDEIEKSFQDFDVNLSTIFLSFARGAIGGFLLSLIIAAFMRK